MNDIDHYRQERAQEAWDAYQREWREAKRARRAARHAKAKAVIARWLFRFVYWFSSLGKGR